MPRKLRHMDEETQFARALELRREAIEGRYDDRNYTLRAKLLTLGFTRNESRAFEQEVFEARYSKEQQTSIRANNQPMKGFKTW